MNDPTPISEADVVVVDNASSDGTMALLRLMASTNPRISVVRNEDNKGFAAACNQGASALSTPWVAFVNPDCFVRGDSLPRLVQYGLQRVGAGIAFQDVVVLAAK